MAEELQSLTPIKKSRPKNHTERLFLDLDAAMVRGDWIMQRPEMPCPRSPFSTPKRKGNSTWKAN